jgi:hypothetical protein
MMRLAGLVLFGGLIFLFNSSFERSKTYPQQFFDWPVRHAVRISGTFGELRPNHFHAGIDIKSSRGKSGDPLYAAGDGYISRIKVSATGYGNVLYIDHPNGYTSVYAHMHRFSDELDEFVKEQQYLQQHFEVEIFTEKDQFRVSKGQQIGQMGNTGGSMGPHLHFEIRDTESEKPINPFLFGLKIRDTRPPRMHELKVYQMNDDWEVINDRKYTLRSIRNGAYELRVDTVVVHTPQAGFALKVYDHHDEVSNWNGIYGLSMEVDEAPAFGFEMETFAFDETRYINALLDYPERITRKSYFNRCFQFPGNQLSIYENTDRRGLLDLSDGKARQVRITASDVEENESKLSFWVKYEPKELPDHTSTYNYELLYNEPNLIELEGCTLYFPGGALYTDQKMDIRISEDASSDNFSRVYHVHDYQTPVHDYYEVFIEPDRDIPESLKDKAFIALCDGQGRVTNMGGEWSYGKLKTQVRTMGDFCIMTDTKAPTITPLSFRQDMRGRSTMSFKILDNINTARHVSGLQYKATVDGKWILMNYDKKYDRLSHRFDGTISTGNHTFRLEVTDAVGNTSVFERSFQR